MKGNCLILFYYILLYLITFNYQNFPPSSEGGDIILTGGNGDLAGSVGIRAGEGSDGNVGDISMHGGFVDVEGSKIALKASKGGSLSLTGVL